MTAWYFNPAHFRDERAAIDALAARAEWLRPLRWRLDDQMRLTFEADIILPHITRPVILQYPNHYAKAPPLVLPRGDKSRWSGHQWGAGGELCLEWRPDNWHEGITGADMLESAYRLLEGEQPDSVTGGVVPSAHVMSEGQRLRGKAVRLFPTLAAKAFLATVELGSKLSAQVVMLYHDEVFVHCIREVRDGDKVVWSDPEISKQLVFESVNMQADVLRLPESASLPTDETASAFDADIIALGHTRTQDYVIVLHGDAIHLYKVYNDNQAFYCPMMKTPPDARRIDDSHAGMRSKKVAIVGCGSLGSKIAAMLARAGVGHFLLIDDDIFYPGNLVRHDLDWRDMGSHKAEAIARRISFINASATSTVRRVRLGGQEAANSVNNLIELFKGYDLIVDTTADPVVFNYLAAVPEKSLIWGEVFGGGFGGLIARYRPGVEPPIQQMRQEIEAWFAENSDGKPRLASGYGADRDGVTWIADDADVSVIAAHVARFAIDMLIGRDPSLFPNSVYAIGMDKGSVFEAPFDTRPIVVGAPLPTVPRAVLSQEEIQEQFNALVEIISASVDEANRSSENNPKA